MQQFFDVIQSTTGMALPNTQVTVYNSSGALATLYSNNGVTLKGNPVTTNSDGEYFFYAANGTYSISYSATGYVSEARTGIILYDPADASIGSNQISYNEGGTGAVNRTVLSKLQESISVLDFGADPTGVVDSAPAFQAAVDSLSPSNSHVGGMIIIPKGTYKLNSTWNIRKRVTIIGTNAGDQPQTSATILLFPADTDGIRFFSSVDSSTGTDATQSVLQYVEVRATVKNVSGVGIKCTTQVSIEHCIVRDFKSHGIEFHGQTGTGATGIADFWKVSNCRIVTNGGNGLYTHGNDSQIGVATQVECIANGGYGFYDISAYGNTYIACQASGNTGGSYYNIASTTYYGSTYLGCYVEFGATAPPVFNADSIVLGGVLSAVAGNASNITHRYPGGFGPNVGSSGRHMWFRNNAEIARIDTDNVLSGLVGLNITASATNYQTFGSQIISQTTSSTSNEDRFRFDNPNGRVGSISTTGSSTAYNTSSDYRLKNITGDLINSGAFIDALKPKVGSWKADGTPFVGFVAHEVQEVSPSTVSGEKDATEDVGDVFDNKSTLVYKNVEKPNTLPEEWTWVYTTTVPKIQHMEYGSAEFIANIVAELQSLRKRVTALETKT